MCIYYIDRRHRDIVSIYNIYRDTKRDIDGQLRYGADIYRDI